jgi:hypothetical protein
MESVLAKTKQAVSRYKSRSQSDNLNATKSVWAAVRFLRKQLPELEKQDRGVTTRIARELSELLSKLPMFRYLREDKDSSENLHSKPQAEELIQKLENQLKTLVKDLENSKIDEIRGWVENHPVLGTLTKTLTRKMPDSTYVFLFRQTKGGSVELVTSRSPDGRVFTRFRPREFFDVKKLYRLYNHRPPVGAAVVVDNKLQDVIGVVPEAGENTDQLHVISALSKEAASQPAKAFLSSNPVLQKLHSLVKDRKVDKNAYILLFVEAHEEIDFDAELDDELAAGDHSTHAEAGDETGSDSESSESAESAGEGAAEAESETTGGEEGLSTEEPAAQEPALETPASEERETPTPDEPAAEPEAEKPADEQSTDVAAEAPGTPAADASDQSTDVDASAAKTASEGTIASSSDGTQGEAHTNESNEPTEEPASDEGAEPGDTAGDAESTADAGEETSEPTSEAGADTDSDEVPIHGGPVEILTRTGGEGGVLTRYYGNEFSDVRKVFETFGGQRTIAGAAIVRGRELIQVIGNVPQPHDGRSQLDVLLSESNHAADKPTRDFLAENEILNSLHELATGDFPDANAKVLLFVEEEGRLSAMVPPPPPPQREERGRGGDRNRGGDRGRNDRGRGRDDRGRDNRGRSGKASLLTDFRYPREIRNSYRNCPRVVGASVIGEFKAPNIQRKDGPQGGDNRGPSSRDDKRGRDNRGRNDVRPPSKSVVLAAFGRTPLKQNILITEETTRRLGLDSALIY